MSGVAGFDWQGLARRAQLAPFNEALQYEVQVQPYPGEARGWRCIGVYHLASAENNSRHNVFLEVLDMTGARTNAPLIKWRWWDTAPVQTRYIDKPNTEPGADVPIDKGATVQVWVEFGGFASDIVTGLHARHDDEGSGNTWGHHSFYVVFQLRGGIVQPPPDRPKTLEERVAALEAWRKQMEGN